jgi:Electron transfer DM13
VKTSADVHQRKPLLKRRIVWIPLAVIALLIVIALPMFEPWTLWINKTVTEAGPAGTELARGELISHEHHTTGTARVLEMADGSRVLRLENLDTSSGPDLKVWLSDADVVPGRAGWQLFDDGKYLNLGSLKGNKGNQNYALPRDANLDDYRSVSVWCDRFNVSFGASLLVRR